MTRAQLARFWDEQLAAWLRGESLSPRLTEWRHAYNGDVQEWAFPEPYVGDLLGSPRMVLLANNPGVAHKELQARDGTFATMIRETGLTAWAATRPFEGPNSPWVRLTGREIAHNWDRIRFAGRFLGDAQLSRFDVLNMELFPWHSPKLERAIRVDPETLHEFVLEPLSEFSADVPVVALGVAWARALDEVPEVVASCERIADFTVPSRQAWLYSTRDGTRILVVWHSGSDKPPNAADTERLRAIWFGERHLPPPNLRAVPGTAAEGGAMSNLDPSAARSAVSRTGGGGAALSETLQRWVAETFAGVAEVRETTAGRPRLHVRGAGAQLGWDVWPDFITVWVKKLRDGDRELLNKLSEPDSVQPRPQSKDTRFRVRNDADAQLLRELIRRHVQAELL